MLLNSPIMFFASFISLALASSVLAGSVKNGTTLDKKLSTRLSPVTKDGAAVTKPPPTSDVVFTLSTSILIDAPVEKVWSILLDFESYYDWNPFRRRQIILDWKTRKPLPSQVLKEGQLVLVDPIYTPPTMGEATPEQTSSAYVKCFVLDPANYRQAWTSDGSTPKYLLYPVRWDNLTVIAHGKTKYESTEVVKGTQAHLIGLTQRANLQLGFEGMAEALKRRAEGSA